PLPPPPLPYTTLFRSLLVLLGIVAIAILSLPNNSQKAQNIVALASSAFGVIGAVVGAYFGVRAAGNAVERVAEQRARTPPAGPRDRKSTRLNSSHQII